MMRLSPICSPRGTPPLVLFENEQALVHFRREPDITERTRLRSDINCCYAQIEYPERPEPHSRPVVGDGDKETCHGIMLAKNLLAKALGVGAVGTL